MQYRYIWYEENVAKNSDQIIQGGVSKFKITAFLKCLNDMIWIFDKRMKVQYS